MNLHWSRALTRNLHVSEAIPAASISGWYGQKVRSWFTGIATGYAVAVTLLVGALASFLASIGVGFGALFHFTELRYGTTTAYEIVGGLLAVLAMLGAIAGISQLRRALPPPPDAGQHARAASRIVAAQSFATLTSSGNALKARHVTPATISIASIGLLGWLVASRLARARKTPPQ